MGEDRGQGLTRPLFDRLAFQSTVVTPALFLAPMAGVTHSAFRRLLGDFGGHGAVFTEMVSASAFLKENADLSPFTKRRPIEGPVVIQFRMSDEDRVEAVIEKAAALAPLAIDLNLGCPAPKIQQQASGAALWRDFARLASVLRRIRSVYGGPLSVKVRLGDPTEDWRTPFLERMKLFEDAGVDVLTVHPRFSDEKLKRRARWELFPWIADQTRLPVLGNGDVTRPEDVSGHTEAFAPLAGLMLGRAAAVRPWLFRAFAGLPPVAIDHAEVWDRLWGYTLEDFPPERALRRMQEFTVYFAQNFTFGHQLYKAVQVARDVHDLRRIALAFLEAGPQLRRN